VTGGGPNEPATRVGGNAVIAAAGSTIAGGNVSGTIGDASEGAAVIAQENVLLRLSGAESPPPFTAWPTDTFIDGHKDLFFNGEAIQIVHRPAAHTDGDSIVFFRRSDGSAPATSSTPRPTPCCVEGHGSIQASSIR
jgi:hypothetical protein